MFIKKLDTGNPDLLEKQIESFILNPNVNFRVLRDDSYQLYISDIFNNCLYIKFHDDAHGKRTILNQQIKNGNSNNYVIPGHNLKKVIDEQLLNIAIKEQLTNIINDKTVNFRWDKSDYNPSELKYIFTGANNLMDVNMKNFGLYMEIIIQKLYERGLEKHLGTEVIFKTIKQENSYPMELITRTYEILIPDFNLFESIQKRYTETVPDATKKYKPISEQYKKIKKYLVDFEITKNVKKTK